MAKWNVHAKKATYHFDDSAGDILVIDDDIERIGEFCKKIEDVKKIENARYDIFTGNYSGKQITAVGTHMTSGNTAIIIDQYIEKGVKYIFKLGTFGALQPDIQTGDIYLASGAVRAEGLTDAYAPMYYPAVPCFELLHLLKSVAEEKDVKVKSGIIHSVNIYSPYYTKTPSPEKYDPYLYQKLGVIGVEMEISSTYTIASVKGVRAAAVVVCSRDWKTQEAAIRKETVDWRSDEDRQRKDESHKQVRQMILDTIAIL